MANEALVKAVKDIVSLLKSGDLDAAYHGYRDLFSDAAFVTYRPEDQRQALKLMILSKGAPSPLTPVMKVAYGAALAPLEALVATLGESADHELLGICQYVVGDEAGASATFKAGLAIERERDPQSKLCGSLMKRVSMV